MTATEAARLTGVDVRCIARWCRDGNVPSARLLGSRWYMRRSELRSFFGVD